MVGLKLKDDFYTPDKYVEVIELEGEKNRKDYRQYELLDTLDTLGTQKTKILEGEAIIEPYMDEYESIKGKLTPTKEETIRYKELHEKIKDISAKNDTIWKSVGLTVAQDKLMIEYETNYRKLIFKDGFYKYWLPKVYEIEDIEKLSINEIVEAFDHYFLSVHSHQSTQELVAEAS